MLTQVCSCRPACSIASALVLLRAHGACSNFPVAEWQLRCRAQSETLRQWWVHFGCIAAQLGTVGMQWDALFSKCMRAVSNHDASAIQLLSAKLHTCMHLGQAMACSRSSAALATHLDRFAAATNADHCCKGVCPMSQ